jgi:hypothetical protein
MPQEIDLIKTTGGIVGLDHIISILNILAYPVFGLMAFFYQKGVKEKKEFADKVERDMKAVYQTINLHREESFTRFVTTGTFDRAVQSIEKNMDYMRNRIDDVAEAVGARQRKKD